MSRYIVLVNFTEEGAKTVKDLPKRFERAREKIEKAGGRIVDWNLTLGPYDVILTVEVPNEQTGVGLLLAEGSIGFIKTTTLRAFTLEETKEIITRLP